MSYLGPGFIREEKDVMYLILYALRFFPFAISEGDLMDVVLIDDGFGYFEFRSAFLRLQEGKPFDDVMMCSYSPVTLRNSESARNAFWVIGMILVPLGGQINETIKT